MWSIKNVPVNIYIYACKFIRSYTIFLISTLFNRECCVHACTANFYHFESIDFFSIFTKYTIVCTNLKLCEQLWHDHIQYLFMIQITKFIFLKRLWLARVKWNIESFLWSTVYSVSQKSNPPPLKHFAIFSLMVNLCIWKSLWLLPKHISIFTPIVVYLSEYLYELYHFY